jgi:hypothetical protein
VGERQIDIYEPQLITAQRIESSSTHIAVASCTDFCKSAGFEKEGALS